MTSSVVSWVRISAIIVGMITGIALLVEGIPQGNLKDTCIGVGLLYFCFVNGLAPLVFGLRRPGSRK
jgi:hypothetical protein